MHNGALRTSSLFEWQNQTLFLKANRTPDRRGSCNIRHLLSLVFIELAEREIAVQCRFVVEGDWVVAQCIEWMSATENRNKIISFQAEPNVLCGQLPILELTDFLVLSESLISFRILGYFSFEGLNSHSALTQLLGAMRLADRMRVFGDNLELIVLNLSCYDGLYEDPVRTERVVQQIGSRWDIEVHDVSDDDENKIVFIWRKRVVPPPREQTPPLNTEPPPLTRRRLALQRRLV